MKPSIRRALQGAPWILLLNFEDAQRAQRHGYMTAAQWNAYRWAWTWAAPRFGGDAALAQDAFHARHGDEALQRRRARVRALLSLLTHS